MKILCFNLQTGIQHPRIKLHQDRNESYGSQVSCARWRLNLRKTSASDAMPIMRSTNVAASST
eukprot:14153936-Heterocapsa_arctica.AAC.1